MLRLGNGPQPGAVGSRARIRLLLRMRQGSALPKLCQLRTACGARHPLDVSHRGGRQRGGSWESAENRKRGRARMGHRMLLLPRRTGRGTRRTGTTAGDPSLATRGLDIVWRLCRYLRDPQGWQSPVGSSVPPLQNLARAAAQLAHRRMEAT